jgi:hypothetical protein
MNRRPGSIVASDGVPHASGLTATGSNAREQFVDLGDLLVWGRAMVSASQASGSTSFGLAVSIRVQAMAAAFPPASEPTTR